MNGSLPCGQILKMVLLFLGQVFFEPGFQGMRKRYDPGLGSLAVDNDGPLPEVDVLDPQPERFYQSKTGAVHQLGC